MQCEPQKEHAWLANLVGDWAITSECAMGPDQPTQTVKGRESVRLLGGMWAIGEGEMEMPGHAQPGKTMITIGFDPSAGGYVGTWIGSMMSKLWVYKGEMDAAGKTLALHAEGPSFTDPNKTAKYKDVIELVDKDLRRFSSHLQGDDGKWVQFMKAEYRRVK